MTELVRTYKLTDSGAWGWVTEEAEGGGSGDGAARVLGPFPFAFDTPSLADGDEFYTPTVGDILLNAWVELIEAWDGTTPLGDVGQFVDVDFGLWGAIFGPWAADNDIDNESDYFGTGLLSQSSGTTDRAAIAINTAVSFSGSGSLYRPIPARFTTTDPVKVVVSQDGQKGGADPGATQGSGAVYLVVATPSLT